MGRMLGEGALQSLCPPALFPANLGGGRRNCATTSQKRTKPWGAATVQPEVLGGPLCRQELDLMIRTGPFHLGIFCDPLWGYSG